MSTTQIPPDIKIVLVYGYEPGITPACQTLRQQFEPRTSELIMAGHAMKLRRVVEDTSENRKIILMMRLHEIINEGYKVIIVGGIPACIDLAAAFVSDFGGRIYVFNVVTNADIVIHRTVLNRHKEIAFRADLEHHERSLESTLAFYRHLRLLWPDVLGTRAPTEQASYMRNRIAPDAARKIAVSA